MAFNLGTLFLKVDADKKEFDKAMDSVNKRSKTLMKTFAVVGAAGVAAFAAVTVQAVKAAAEQEKAEARLESIAKKVTKATDAQVKSLKELAAQYQKVSTFGDEVIIVGQSQLLSFGLQTESAEKLTQSLVDLLAANKGVEATSQDAIDAANMLGKAFMGQAGALTRAGIILNDVQAEILKTGTETEKVAALTEILEQNYGGLAETLSKTTEGQLKQVQNAWGDILEQIGFKLIPKLQELLDWILQNMPQIERVTVGVFDAIFKTMQFIIENAKILTLALTTLAGAFIGLKVVSAINAILIAYAAAQTTATAATGASTVALTLFQAIPIVAAITAAVVALAYYATHFDEVNNAIVEATKSLGEFIKGTEALDAAQRRIEKVFPELLEPGEDKPEFVKRFEREQRVREQQMEELTRPRFEELPLAPVAEPPTGRFDFESLIPTGTERISTPIGANININIQSNDPDLIGNEVVRRLHSQGIMA